MPLLTRCLSVPALHVGRWTPALRTAFLRCFLSDFAQIHVHGFDHKAPLMLREVLKRLLDLGPHLKEGARHELYLPVLLNIIQQRVI